MTFLPTEDLNAEKASESAFRQVSTMLPGAPMYAEMQQLAAAYSAKGSKEEVFVRQVVAIGELLQVPVTQIWLPSCEKHHYCIQIQDVAKHLLDVYPGKLLAGCNSSNIGDFKKLLIEFWNSYAKFYASHPVFTDHANELGSCIPVKMHSDEGTGLRKTAVQQYSWGPILAESGSSLDRYFFSRVSTRSNTKLTIVATLWAMLCLTMFANILLRKQRKHIRMESCQLLSAIFIWYLSDWKVTSLHKLAYIDCAGISVAHQIACVLGATQMILQFRILTAGTVPGGDLRCTQVGHGTRRGHCCTFQAAMMKSSWRRTSFIYVIWGRFVALWWTHCAI